MNNKELLARIERVQKDFDLSARMGEDKESKDTDAIMERFHAACDLLPDMSGSYHRDNVLELLHDVMSECYNNEDEADEDAIADTITEYADSDTPIYYHDIAKWFAENWKAVDDFVDETGTPDEFDIMKTIQGAYCYTLEQEARRTLSAIIEGEEDEGPSTTNEVKCTKCHSVRLPEDMRGDYCIVCAKDIPE